MNINFMGHNPAQFFSLVGKPILFADATLLQNPPKNLAFEKNIGRF